MPNRIVLGIEYSGTRYVGWQHQAGQLSVQGTLEAALSRLANRSIVVCAAGRTDAGVHALGQIVHFETDCHRDFYAWVAGTNFYLPPDIRVQFATAVPPDFHARFSAIKRHYSYTIDNRKAKSALFHAMSAWEPCTLDAAAMQEGANYLLGEHDFSAFRGAQCQSHSPCRDLQQIHVVREGEWIRIDVVANAFLHHMVRNIVGTLWMVGLGKKEPAWVKTVLESRDRTQAGKMAPACGLCLQQVHYPSEFLLKEKQDELVNEAISLSYFN